jgi:hypothetical protein
MKDGISVSMVGAGDQTIVNKDGQEDKWSSSAFVDTRVLMGSNKVVSYQERGETLVPDARGLAEAIDRFSQTTYVLRVRNIFEVGQLHHI